MQNLPTVVNVLFDYNMYNCQTKYMYGGHCHLRPFHFRIPSI